MKKRVNNIEKQLEKVKNWEAAFAALIEAEKKLAEAKADPNCNGFKKYNLRQSVKIRASRLKEFDEN